MPRIKLATWYGDKAPGEELDVDGAALKAMRRDGLVAEVLGSTVGGTVQADRAAAVDDASEPEAVHPVPSARRKR
ncbi:hypothetical protein AB0D49_08170 [Streptomyces sp. NPDC048290]|uniref:hypothetical protein n=1 Tax=Streptomyces sp. NPDC048290 TaxID=3155811 RepID=UPI00343B9843